MDPRLLERRREVAEDRARRNVTRLIRALAVLALAGGLVWLALSPWLRVKEVVTTGVVASSANATLVEEGIMAGTPLLLIRADEVVARLEVDPWVRDAAVDVEWPDRVVVRVEERFPAAWVETADGWSRRAVDGVALPSASEPDASLPWAHFADVAGSDAGEDPRVVGALEFAAALPEELAHGARVWVEPSGELWAEVTGFLVRLGRPLEMEEKALSTAALLAESPPAGSILTMIAPTNPATTPSQPGEEPVVAKP